MMREGFLAIEPFEMEKPDERLTPAGFNFSFSKLIISKMNHELVPLTVGKDSEVFFNLASGDMALALTNESIWVSRFLAGTFHSKVSYVSQGLGHISTTLDPGWKGQLLIAINNPYSDDIKVVIGEKKDTGIKYSTFITLCLYKLDYPASDGSDNNDLRTDVLQKVIDDHDDKNSDGYKKANGIINEIKGLLMCSNSPKAGDGFACISEQNRLLFKEQQKKISDLIMNELPETDKE